MSIRIVKGPEELILFASHEKVGYQKPMLEKTSWVLPHQWDRKGEETWLRFRHGQGQPLNRWLRQRPEPYELKQFFRCMIRLDQEVERYLLDAGRVYFDPAWIEWEKEKGQVQIAYIPFAASLQGGVPFWTRLARYCHQTAIQDEWKEATTVQLLFQIEKAAYRKSLGLADWAAPLTDEIGEKTLPEGEAGLEKSFVMPKDYWQEEQMAKEERRELALNQLIAASQEPDHPLQNQMKSHLQELWDRFPLRLKD